MTPVQYVFDVIKTAVPLPANQRESLMGNAEEWFRTLGMATEANPEPSKLELLLAKILKHWMFMTLLALLSIPTKRYVLDYLAGNLAEGDEDEEDEDDEDDEEEEEQPRRRSRR